MGSKCTFPNAVAEEAFEGHFDTIRPVVSAATSGHYCWNDKHRYYTWLIQMHGSRIPQAEDDVVAPRTC